MLPIREDVLRAAVFRNSRSGGKGGQNVNKVSSKVELILDIKLLSTLNPEEATLLQERLAGRLDKEGLLHIVSQEDRSQFINREKAVVKTLELLKSALQVRKKRKPTKISQAGVRRRLTNKRSTAAKKTMRRRPQEDG